MKQSTSVCCEVRDKVLTRLNNLRKNRAEAKIVALRVLLICSYLAAAGTCTAIAYSTLHDNETTRLREQFTSVSDSAIASVDKSFFRMTVGAQVLASTYGHLFPHAEEWPNVAWMGFDPTASLLSPVSSMDGMMIMPLVQPDEVPNYESFLDTFYTNNTYVQKDQFYPTIFPNISVWSTDADGVQYHDTTGVVTFSDRTVLTPISQYTYSTYIGPHYGAYNMHSNSIYASAIDRSIECIEAGQHVNSSHSCGKLSDVLQASFANAENTSSETVDMVAVAIFPIFPVHNATVLTGFAGGSLSWIQLLTDVVPSYVQDVECVVHTEGSVFTMSIVGGVPTFRGLGDLHDSAFTHYGSTSVLANSGVKVTFYPTEEFVDEYLTDQPVVSACTLLAMFVFCAVVFAFYDGFMGREFTRREGVLDTKRRFVRFISHEIRTPLNTVRLGLKLFDLEIDKLTELIGSTPLCDLAALITSSLENWTQLTQDILVNSESAVEVLDDLLNYDKIEVGALRLEFTFFNYGALIKTVTSTMQIMAQQKNICLELTFFNSMPDQYAVIGDESRMAQVLRNLISNALKFTPPEGRIALTVSLDTSRTAEIPLKAQQESRLFATHSRAGMCSVSVQDSGAGLSPQQLSQICSEGVQFNANELQAGQGSGLGLFISKGIVEQHGGKMTVTSEGLGKGVTFTIELPLFHVPEELVPSFSRTTSSKKNSVMFSSAPIDTTPELQRFLVVDDSHFNRKMLVRLLTARGFTCEQAEDGADALKVFTEMRKKKERVDVVLMDFEMPVMNGPTATKKLREMGCTALIVGVTGNILPDEVAFFIEHGADAVLRKPLVLEDLEKLLVQQAANRRASQQQQQQRSPRQTHSEASTVRDRNTMLLQPAKGSGKSTHRVYPSEQVV